MIGTPHLEAPAPLVVPPVTLESMQAYLAVSGDVNPLHVDSELADRIGLAGLPVPGMLVMAMIANYIASWPRRKATLRLSARFTAPVYVGETITISARVARHPSEGHPHPILRVFAKQNGRMAVVAEAQVSLS